MEKASGNENSELGQDEKVDDADAIEDSKVDAEKMEETNKDDATAVSGDGNTPSVSSPPPPADEFENGRVEEESASTSRTTVGVKVTVDRSIRGSIPALTKSVFSAFKSASFSPRSFSPPSLYGSKPWGFSSSRHMRLVEVILRFGGAVLSLIAFSVMAATNEKRSGAGSNFKIKFSDFQAYNYLVALNVISFIYSSWQLILLGQPGSSSILSLPFNPKLSVYICDQILAFLMFSASSAAATAAELSRHGLRNIWPPACSTWSLWLFCSKADGAVVMSFFSSFFVISSSVFSGYHLKSQE